MKTATLYSTILASNRGAVFEAATRESPGIAWYTASRTFPLPFLHLLLPLPCSLRYRYRSENRKVTNKKGGKNLHTVYGKSRLTSRWKERKVSEWTGENGEDEEERCRLLKPRRKRVSRLSRARRRSINCRIMNEVNRQLDECRLALHPWSAVPLTGHHIYIIIPGANEIFIAWKYRCATLDALYRSINHPSACTHP